MPAIDRLLTQLDRKTQEVEIEARVVAATRSFARDIGTQLGFGWGNGTAAVGGASSVGTSPTTVGGLTSGLHHERYRDHHRKSRFRCSRTCRSPARPAV